MIGGPSRALPLIDSTAEHSQFNRSVGYALDRVAPIGEFAICAPYCLAKFRIQPGNSLVSQNGIPILNAFDRGFPDIVGFLRLEGLPVPDDIDRACRELRYDGPVFRAPPWQAIYRPDDERIQDWDAALESDAAVTAAWRDYGYEPVDLPLASVEERADLVVECLQAGSLSL